MKKSGLKFYAAGLLFLLFSSCSNPLATDNSTSGGGITGPVTTNSYSLSALQTVYVIVHNTNNSTYSAAVWGDNLNGYTNDPPLKARKLSVSASASGTSGAGKSFSYDATPLLPSNDPSAILQGMETGKFASGGGPSSSNVIDYGYWPSSWGSSPAGSYSTSFYVADLTTTELKPASTAGINNINKTDKRVQPGNGLFRPSIPAGRGLMIIASFIMLAFILKSPAFRRFRAEKGVRISYIAFCAVILAACSTNQPAATSSSGSPSYYSVTATLEATGQYCYVFVDNAELANGHIHLTDVSNIMKAFDDIYPNETSLIGNEEGGGAGGNGGIDGNKNVYILLTDIKDGYNGSGGYASGYFDANSESATAPNSNKKEMFVIDTYPTIYENPNGNGILQASIILAHELQHMINYWQKYENGTAEQTWLNEACSVAMEDVMGTFIPSYPSGAALAASNRMAYYLGEPERPLLSWNSGDVNDVLYDYGKSYSFLAFLVRNIGPQVLHEIVNGHGANASGTQSLSQALSFLGYDFNTVYMEWRESFTNWQTPAASANFTGYPANLSGSYNSITYPVQRLDLTNFNVFAPDPVGQVGAGAGPSFYTFTNNTSSLLSYQPYQSRIFEGMVSGTGQVNIYMAGDTSSLIIKTIIVP